MALPARILISREAFLINGVAAVVGDSVLISFLSVKPKPRLGYSLRSLKSKFRGRLGKHKKVMLKTPFRDNRPNPESSSDGNPETRIPPCGFTCVGFDLAADFLYRILVSVDFMTLQTRDIRSTSQKLAGAAPSRASTLASTPCVSV